ncbi:MAG: glycosyltransferase [Bacteroidales bacterium]|nr:glycosyltransferase [Bacteroidales bacterium]
MKIFILAPGHSPHTRKWIKGITEQKHEVILYSFTSYSKKTYADINNFTGYSLGLGKGIGFSKGIIKKLCYFLALPPIKLLIKKHKPDVLHAHYLSSYGLIGALTNFKRYAISVWGTDIFEFAKKNTLQTKIIQYALSKAQVVFSTSEVMKSEISKYTNKTVQVIPFGIDTELFMPQPKSSEKEEFVIGTIKALKEVYGISYLIKAFSILVNEYRIPSLKLILAGLGPEKDNYIKLSRELKVEDRIVFPGFIDPRDVPDVLSTFDIFVAVSLRESFGVAVIEASACELPVVVSNVDGLPEVVINNETGLLVPPKNPKETADALQSLINDRSKRVMMGKNGRKFVLARYKFDKNLIDLLEAYKAMQR